LETTKGIINNEEAFYRIAYRIATNGKEMSFDELISISNANEVITKIVNHVVADLEKKADEMQCDKDKLSSTLLCVAIKNDDVIVFHVGDGLIAGLKNGELKTLTMPDNGEFANATYFIEFFTIISKIFYAINLSETQCSFCRNILYNYQIYYFIVFPLEEVRKFKYEQNFLKNNFNIYQAYNQINNYNNIPKEVSIYDCFDYDKKK